MEKLFATFSDLLNMTWFSYAAYVLLIYKICTLCYYEIVKKMEIVKSKKCYKTQVRNKPAKMDKYSYILEKWERVGASKRIVNSRSILYFICSV